jgi:hypothetical protein
MTDLFLQRDYVMRKVLPQVLGIISIIDIYEMHFDNQVKQSLRLVENSTFSDSEMFIPVIRY